MTKVGALLLPLSLFPHCRPSTPTSRHMIELGCQECPLPQLSPVPNPVKQRSVQGRGQFWRVLSPPVILFPVWVTNNITRHEIPTEFWWEGALLHPEHLELQRQLLALWQTHGRIFCVLNGKLSPSWLRISLPSVQGVSTCRPIGIPWGFLKAQSAGSRPRGSDPVGRGWAQEFASSTRSQVLWMLPLYGSYYK